MVDNRRTRTLTYDLEIDQITPDRLRADLALIAALVPGGHLADPQHPGLAALLVGDVVGLLVVGLVAVGVVVGVLQADGLEPLVGGVGVAAHADDLEAVAADPGNLGRGGNGLSKCST